jgi:hypothetical protein
VGHVGLGKFLEDTLKNVESDGLVKQLTSAQKKALNIGHISKLLTLSNENSAAARILSKEYQQQNLVSICELDSIETKIK